MVRNPLGIYLVVHSFDGFSCFSHDYYLLLSYIIIIHLQNFKKALSAVHKQKILLLIKEYSKNRVKSLNILKDYVKLILKR